MVCSAKTIFAKPGASKMANSSGETRSNVTFASHGFVTVPSTR